MMAEKKPQDQINKELREKWDDLEFDSQLIRAGEDPYPSTTHSLRVPLYATKSYVYSSLTELLKHHYFYSRTENPTLFALDKKLATLHGGEDAISVASGMAAVHLACSSVLQKRIKRVKPKNLSKYFPQQCTSCNCHKYHTKEHLNKTDKMRYTTNCLNVTISYCCKCHH